MAKNFLLVDDSAGMRKLIRKTIGLCSIQVGEIYEASNGREGLEVVARHPVDLIFLDVNMPVMDGIEMLERVMEIPEAKDTPILMVSPESNQSRIGRFSQKNIGYIQKPFTPEVLVRKIVEMLASAETVQGVPAF